MIIIIFDLLKNINLEKIVIRILLEESDTSMTRGLDDNLSIDEDEADDTIELLNDARESLNINGNKRVEPGTKRKTQKEPNTNA